MHPNLSERQSEFYLGSTAFLNIADGAVRSGKTHAALWRFIVHTQVAPPGDMMMLGRTRETVERNAISVLREHLGQRRVRYNRGLGLLQISGRQIYVVGVNDAQAEAKIRGSTLAGSYCNELTILQDEAFEQLIDRHSIRGSKIFGDTNADSPYHWLNQKYLENDNLADIDLFRVRFSLEDNPFLPPEYVSRLRRIHQGLWEKRMVDGLWVIAEGAVYDTFDPDGPMVVDVLPARETFERYIVGVDYGTSNKTVFLLLGFARGVWYVVDEYVHDSRQTGRQKTDGQYVADFVDFVDGIKVERVMVDPSAASFKLELRGVGVQGVQDANNVVLDGIRNTAQMLNEGALRISRRCQSTLESLAVYAWDKKAQQRGEDKPLKTNDHEADSLRYAVSYICDPTPEPRIRAVG